MRKILIHSVGYLNNNIFDLGLRDNHNRPFLYLKEKLFELGYDLITSDNNSLDDVEYVFFHDYNSVYPYHGFLGKIKYVLSFFLKKFKVRELYNEVKSSNVKSILFIWEGAAVMPNNWKSDLHELFDIIFTWDDNYVDNIKFFKFFLPQTDVFPIVKETLFLDKKLLVNISMNKSSNHSLELYSERLKMISFFDKFYSHNFDLFGFGWNDSNCFVNVLNYKYFKSYKGTVKNKWDVLPNYKFAICFENLRDTPGYITEKIFDCFRCKCVPIYWGASNITEYVPNGTFIDMRNFSKIEDLEFFITNMSQLEYDKYILEIERYLDSDSFFRFSPQYFYYTISKHLD